MNLELKAETILKLAFLVILLILLTYLVIKLMVFDEKIQIMINVNKTFI